MSKVALVTAGTHRISTGACEALKDAGYKVPAKQFTEQARIPTDKLNVGDSPICQAAQYG